MTKKKKLTLLSWNVNGIRAVHKKEALGSIFKEGADILCLQETKASQEQLPFDLRYVKGYTSYFSSAKRKGYSGVALYTQLKPRSITYGLGTQKFDDEGRILTAEYEQFTLCNVYFPNGKASKERLKFKMDFYATFLGYLDSLKKQGRKIIFCGDVNTAHKEIDLARPKENSKISGFLPKERAWIDKVIKGGYFDTFRKFHKEGEQYTWWDLKSRARDRNVGWRIDYFFASNNLKKYITDAYIRSDVYGSDHCPVGIEVVV